MQDVRHHKDPIALMKERIESGSLATHKELKEIEHDINEEIKIALEKAKASPEPKLEEFAADVYCKNLEGDYLRGITYKQKLPHVNLFTH